MQVRNTQGINELRTRVWVGEINVNKKSTAVDLFSRFSNSYVGRLSLLHETYAIEVHKYICESMFCVRTFLPGKLYSLQLGPYAQPSLPGSCVES